MFLVVLLFGGGTASTQSSTSTKGGGFTTEAVPAPGDTETMMRWYLDSSHYKKGLADLMLDRLFGYAAPERVVPDSFGVLVNSENIDGHLQKIRADRQNYRDTHPDDIAEIEKVYSALRR